MTVRELIEKLQEFDDNCEVICYESDEYGYVSTCRATEVYDVKRPFYKEDTKDEIFIMIL